MIASGDVKRSIFRLSIFFTLSICRTSKHLTIDSRKSCRQSDICAPSSSKKIKLPQSTYGSQPNIHQNGATSSADIRRSTLKQSSSIINVRTPSKGQSSTSELHRKACADNVQKIIRVLQYDTVFFHRLNLNVSNGLKSMSAKQFIDIIAHFVGIVSGKTINTNRPSDCETDVLNFMKSLGYSTPVSKSWLKTPTAPHAYSECVALLAWMSDLVDQGDDEHMMDAFYSDECDANFPDVEFTKVFSKEIRNGFQVWNGQDDDGFDRWIQQLVEEHVIASMKYRVRNCNELNELVIGMNNTIAQLKEVDDTIPNEKLFETMAERMHHNETQLKTLTRSIAKKSEKLAALDLVYRDQQLAIDAKQQIIEKKQQTLSKQRCNIDDYKLAKAKLPTLMQTIGLRRTEIETIDNDSRTYQLQLARLMQQKNDAIAKLNRIGFRITQIILLTKLHDPFDANAIQIDSNATNDAVRTVCKAMELLIESIESRKQQNGFGIEQKNLELSKLKMLEKHHSDRYDAAEAKFQKLKDQLNNANGSLFQLQESCENTIGEAEKRFERMIGERHTLTEQIDACKARLKLLQQENVSILDDGERKAAELMEVKTKMIKNLDDAIACIDETVNNSNETHANDNK